MEYFRYILALFIAYLVIDSQSNINDFSGFNSFKYSSILYLGSLIGMNAGILFGIFTKPSSVIYKSGVDLLKIKFFYWMGAGIMGSFIVTAILTMLFYLFFGIFSYLIYLIVIPSLIWFTHNLIEKVK